MTAILGQFHLDDSPIDPTQFAAGMAALAHYGVERSGTWIEEQIGLGCHLRCFTPESLSEAQPYRAHDRAIVADARIDNRDELCDRMGIPLDERSTIPDSALILRAYEQWGENCTAHLIGDFAFAIWDAPQRRLFCARDPIGARPFYYQHSAACFAFATDPTGLVASSALSAAPVRLDERQVAAYLAAPMVFPKRHTFYADIFKLPPGSQLTVSATRLQERIYWSPEISPHARIIYKDPREYADHLRHLIEEAVRCRLRTTFPVASHMSGGLDSSGVTVIAARLLRERGRELVRAYTWSPPISEQYPLMEGDERSRIQQICQQENIAWVSCDETPLEVRDFYAHDIAAETQTDLSTEKLVLRDAAQHHIRAILSGWGGDDAVTHHGNGYLPDLLATGHWFWLAKRLYILHGRHPRRAAAYFFREAALPLLPTPLYNRFTRGGSAPPSYAKPAFSATAYPHDGLQRDVRGLHVMMARQLRNGHITGRMEGWNIWGAQHQIGYSYPLTDKRLLDFVLAVPPDMMVSLRQNRVLYRRAMAGILPANLRNGIAKYDAANELQRKRLREGMLALLAEEVRQGLWGGDCDWLDMPRLREALLHPPPQDTEQQVYQFLQMRTAVEVWHLWQRYHPH